MYVMLSTYYKCHCLVSIAICNSFPPIYFKPDELPAGTVDVRETTTTTINLVWLTTDLNTLAFFISYKPGTQPTQTLSVSPEIVYAEYTLDSLTAGELYTIRVQSGDNDLNDEITQRTRKYDFKISAQVHVASLKENLTLIDIYSKRT